MKQLLGIDLGEARVGVAISDEIGLLAHPLVTIQVGNGKDLIRQIAAIVREKKIQAVVVGLPRNMDGSIGPAAKQALSFVERLRPHLSCPVITSDERLTTLAANRALHEAGRSMRKTRKCIDQVAAQIILQNHLDQLRMRAGNPPATDSSAE
jgi:putative Holliday junction resolvase